MNPYVLPHLSLGIRAMNDTQKIAAIKKEIESTHLNTLEDMGEMLDSIIRIVYGVEKKEKLVPKKNIMA